MALEGFWNGWASARKGTESSGAGEAYPSCIYQYHLPLSPAPAAMADEAVIAGETGSVTAVCPIRCSDLRSKQNLMNGHSVHTCYFLAMNIPYSFGTCRMPSVIFFFSTDRTSSLGIFCRSVIPVSEKI